VPFESLHTLAILVRSRQLSLPVIEQSAVSCVTPVWRCILDPNNHRQCPAPLLAFPPGEGEDHRPRHLDLRLERFLGRAVLVNPTLMRTSSRPRLIRTPRMSLHDLSFQVPQENFLCVSQASSNSCVARLVLIRSSSTLYTRQQSICSQRPRGHCIACILCPVRQERQRKCLITCPSTVKLIVWWTGTFLLPPRAWNRRRRNRND
jgi:hypothetical protein